MTQSYLFCRRTKRILHTSSPRAMVQFTAEAFRDSTVTAHYVVAQKLDLLICAALDVHFKNPLPADLRPGTIRSARCSNCSRMSTISGFLIFASF